MSMFLQSFSLNNVILRFSRSLSKDPVAPVLAFKHYPALERRLGKVMKYLLECLDGHKPDKMFLTEYHNPSVNYADPDDSDDDDEKKDEPQPVNQPAV